MRVRHKITQHGVWLTGIVWLWCAGGLVFGGDDAAAKPSPAPIETVAQPHYSLSCLARMDWLELEQLYRKSPAGTTPVGYLRGRAIYRPCDFLSGTKSAVSRTLWHGKDFHCDGTLVNQWSGIRAIKARVYYGPSWLDGGCSIIMDYSETSHVWADVRDEIREVCPGVYLGVMYRRHCPEPKRKMLFALEVSD
jgi:hypothetical protein